MAELTGWFFIYRGDGYGPFKTKTEAREKEIEKFSRDNGYYPFIEEGIFRGTVTVENGRLIEVRRG